MLFVNAVLSGQDTMLQGLQSLLLCTKITSTVLVILLVVNKQVHWVWLDGLGV